MLKIEIIKFEAMDVITASVANPDLPDYPEDLEYCVCPEFKCGINNQEEFYHNPDCNCTTSAHWWAE